MFIVLLLSFFIFTSPIFATDPTVTLNTSYGQATSANYSITGTATSNNGVNLVQYRFKDPLNVESDNWLDCSCSDGSCGGNSEAFTCDITDFPNQSHRTYELRAMENSPNFGLTPSSEYPSISIFRDDDVNIYSWIEIDSPTHAHDFLNKITFDSFYNSVDPKNRIVALLDPIFGYLHRFNPYNPATNAAQLFKFTDTNGNLSFNGTNKNFVVDFWIKPIKTNGTDESVFIYKENNTQDGYSWQILSTASLNAVGRVVTPNGTFSVGENDLQTQLKLGEWNHIEFLFVSESKIAIKVNSNNQVETSLASGDTLLASDKEIVINSIAPSLFSGVIDNIKIYNKNSLNTSISIGPQISLAKKADITVTSTYDIAGTATDTSTISQIQFRPYIPNNTLNDGWQNCACNDGQCDQNSESFTCHITGVTNNNSYLYQIRAVNSLAESTRSDLLSSFSLFRNNQQDLVAWFPLDSANFQTDALGLFTTINTDPSKTLNFDSGYYGRSQTFSYNSSGFQLADSNKVLNFNQQTSKFRLEFYLIPSSLNLNDATILFQKSFSGDPNKPAWRIILNNGKIAASVTKVDAQNNESTTDVGNSSLTAINYDQWNKIIFNYDGSKNYISLKVNDQSATKEYTNLNQPYLPDSNGNLLIGEKLDGEIDDIRIYNSNSDSQGPSFSLSALANPQRVTTSTPQFTLTVTDPSGVKSVEYAPDTNENWISLTPDDGQWNGTTETFTFTTPAYADGTHTIYIKGTDSAGNINFYPNSGIFDWPGVSVEDAIYRYRFTTETVDTTPPDIYVYTISPNPTINNHVQIKGYVKDYLLQNEGDTASNIASIYYRLNNEVDGNNQPVWNSISPSDGNFNSPLEAFTIDLSGLSTGMQQIEIKASDSAGNLTENVTLGESHSNKVEQFEIINQPAGLSVKAVTAEIDFRSHDLQEQLLTEGVWGNGTLHLKQKLTFTENNIIANNTDDFGYSFGDVSTGIYPSLDSNYLWISTDRGDFMYLDKRDNTFTRYPVPLQGSKVENIFEFTAGSNNFLLLSFKQGNYTILYNTNNTKTNTSDDQQIVYSTKTGFNQNYHGFVPFAVDNSGPTTRVWVSLNYSLAGDQNYIALIDTKNTYDIEDDTLTYWGPADGLSFPNNDITAKFFDSTNNRLIIGSYGGGVYTCYLGTSTTDKSDDQCYQLKDTGNNIAASLFSISQDNNGQYWLGGDFGIFRLDPHQNSSPLDDTLTQVLGRNQISGETVQKLSWIAGTYPDGDQIIYVTNQGHVRVFNYNSTYSDTLDDTSFDYQLSTDIYNNSSGALGYIEDKNHVWFIAQSKGINRIDIDYSYESKNTVVIIPPLPLGMVAANYFHLDSVLGQVSPNSLYTLNQLTSYRVSNDGGTTWKAISLGETVYFDTAGDQLRLEITMTKGSTPILEYLKLSFKSYASATEAIIYRPEEMGIVSNNSNSTSDSGSSNSNNSSNTVCNDAYPSLPAPVLYKAVAPSNSSIKLYFQDGGQPISTYHLVYGTKSGKYNMGQLNTAKYKDGQINVFKLKPNTKYYFKIISNNGCQSGPWSNEIAITTTKNKTSSYNGNILTTVKNKISKIFSKTDTANNSTPSTPTLIQPQSQRAVEPTVFAPPVTDVKPPQPQISTSPTKTKKFCLLWWCF